MLKETKSIVSFGLFERIELVGIGEADLPERQNVDDRRSIWRVPLRMTRYGKGLLIQIAKFAELNVKVLWHYRGQGVRMVNCHSSSVFPLGVLCKIIFGAKLIYDTHELESERNGLRGVRKLLTKCVESGCMLFAECILSPTDSCADWYRKRYPRMMVFVAKNIPEQAAIPAARSTELREHCGLRGGELLFIYQGLLGPGRGIERLLDIFSRLPADRHIVFMGNGPLAGAISGRAESFPNIHLHPPAPVHDVLRVTSGADVGVSLIENTSLSYYYSLPNKLFEYVMAGVPPVVSAFPDMGAFVDQHCCGWKSDLSEGALFDFFNGLQRTDVETKKNICLVVRKTLGWYSEEAQLRAAYSAIFPELSST